MTNRSNGGLVNGKSLREINARVPRKVQFDETSIKLLSAMLLILIVGLAGGAWISYGDISTSHVRQILRRKGRSAYGEVTERSANRDGVDVKYKFSVDAVSYSGRAEMIDNPNAVPGVGGDIAIRYLPEDPRINLPMHWKWFSAWDIVPFLATLVFIGIAGVILLSALWERKLARMGLVVEGKVTGCAPKQKSFTVYYEFSTGDDNVTEGNNDLPDEYEVGSSIPIIYLPSNPKRNGCYPVRGFRVAD